MSSLTIYDKAGSINTKQKINKKKPFLGVGGYRTLDRALSLLSRSLHAQMFCIYILSGQKIIAAEL